MAVQEQHDRPAGPQAVADEDRQPVAVDDLLDEALEHARQCGRDTGLRAVVDPVNDGVAGPERTLSDVASEVRAVGKRTALGGDACSVC